MQKTSPETLASIAKALEVEVYELFVFKETIPYDDMRKELLAAMEDNKKFCIFIKCLKGAKFVVPKLLSSYKKTRKQPLRYLSLRVNRTERKTL